MWEGGRKAGGKGGREEERGEKRKRSCYIAGNAAVKGGAKLKDEWQLSPYN